MKWIFRILIVLVLLVVVAGFVVVSKVDTLVTETVETVAPEYTQSQVTLGGVNLSLLSGDMALADLNVGNPTGFTQPNAFTLGEIAVDVDLNSVTTDTIIVNSIEVVAPAVFFEQTAAGTNLQTLQRNIEKAVGPTSDSSSDSESAKKLIIRDFKVTDGLISVTSQLLGEESLDVQLPNIHLTGIGEKSNGATAAEVTEILLGELTSRAKTAVLESGKLGELKAQAKEKLEDKKQDLKDKAAEKLKDLF
ncbi:hypothetical protein QSV34_04910 [Porticoccus sp. W117]|uniref:DUF748 domain-containing protein n=1 Tax=Porticoccus sp. W117 TaxID=3054777 RepID=UPI0025984B15|nr:hypothetical protein [Porticoccus sp. W117]MDM3870687.1 hypothetical protein [Porticoccus sp. W117]